MTERAMKTNEEKQKHSEQEMVETWTEGNGTG